jgi:hypothetical protein
MWIKLEVAMTALLALLALGAVQPAMMHAPSFACTPRLLEVRTGKLWCKEQLAVRLWRVKLVRKNLSVKWAPSIVQSVMNAPEAHFSGDGIIEFGAGTPMRCYSADRGTVRTSQCFVRSMFVFGDEDVACDLVHADLAISTGRYYSSCPKFRPG